MPPILYMLDLFGTMGFALSGALVALHRRPDFVGMLILATATAIGGGTLRDVLLHRPIALLHDPAFPLAILISVILIFIFPAPLQRRENAIRYFDAVGLGIFSAITANAAWQMQVPPLSIPFLAAITGCAGGGIRDVLIQRPTLVLSNEVYVTPMILGSAAMMGTRLLGGTETTGLITAA